ncbi:MAG: DUF1566 domain-containing protein [Treponema sp.]|nr:DUF1566 domain-containing protein [Treponema sp.]
MKKVMFLLVLFAMLVSALFAQAQVLPRLAVFEFSTNIDNREIKADAAAVRNMVESELSSTKKFRIMTRTEIDKLIANQRFQASSISSEENIEILKMEQISYIVTGTVNVMRGDYAITLSILSISSGQISHSDNIQIKSSENFYESVIILVKKFTTGISAGESGRIYNIGDTGPAGGLIFYDRGFVSDGWRYLEAAPAGTDFTAEWGAYRTDVAGTGIEIGSGKRNTELIVNRLRQLGENNRAAQICIGMEINGYKDWFLPSADELILMYKNLKAKGLGSFRENVYWSSTAMEITNPADIAAFFMNFRNPADMNNYGRRVDTYSVRAIRAF